VEAVTALLEEAADLHHRVFRLVDGADDDWASWYADWLLDRSELPAVLGRRPVRSHLVHALVQAERDLAASGSGAPWAGAYARDLVAVFGT
jgi:hypothetical protein